MISKSISSCELPPDFADKLATVLRTALEKDGWRFSCQNSEFTPEEVTAPDGLLPMWLNRAQGVMQRALSPLPPHMSYQMDGGALCGALPAPLEKSASLATWALFTHYAIEEWREMHNDLVLKNQLVPLDELYEEWKGLVRSYAVPLQAPRAPQMDFPGMSDSSPGGLVGAQPGRSSGDMGG